MLVHNLKDSFTRVWLYFLILAVFATLPAFLSEAMSSDFSITTHQQIQQVFPGTLRHEAQIIDGTLVRDTNRSFLMQLGRIAVIVGPRSELSNNFFTFSFQEDGVNIYVLNTLNNTMTYEQIGLENFDFNNTSLAELARFSSAIEIIFQSNRGVLTTIGLIITFGYNALTLLFFIILTAALIRKPLLFGIKFKLCVYAATILTVSLVLSSLFGNLFIFMIGIIVYLIFVFLAFAGIVVQRK
jgi:hypothetical protein